MRQPLCVSYSGKTVTASSDALNAVDFTKQQSDELSVNESETYGLHFPEKIDHVKNEGAKCLGKCIMGFVKAKKDVNYFSYSLHAKGASISRQALSLGTSPK